MYVIFKLAHKQNKPLTLHLTFACSSSTAGIGIVSHTSIETRMEKSSAAKVVLSESLEDNQTSAKDEELQYLNKEAFSKKANRAPERTYPVSSSIDDHSQFWSTYDSISSTFDTELLDGWNKSLDVLLIFAGLFSAINTAFIVESYRGLSPDPAETTNELLRLLLTHRDDHITFSQNDLYPTSPASSSTAVNSLFFSSLSFSLAAAFGAVTAKQWLTDFATVGALSALHDKGRRRQEKFNSLQDWQLRLIIEFLPMLLQISVFLFFAGVFCFLQPLNKSVATLQLVLACVVLGGYLISIAIGTLFPSSPFQSPLSKGLRRLALAICRPLPLILLYISVHVLIMIIFLPVNMILFLLDQYEVPGAEALYSIGESFMEKLRSKALSLLHSQWNPTEITEVDSVVWLLEQAKHPDVALIALNTATMLPPNLLLSRIRLRQGLLARLLGFHEKQLADTMLDGQEWFKTWPNSAVISGMALLHIVKVQPPDDYFAIIRELPLWMIRMASFPNLNIIPQDLLRNNAAVLAIHLSVGLLRKAEDAHALNNLCSLLVQPIHVSLPLLHAQKGHLKRLRGQDAVGKSILPLSLFLDALIYLTWYNHQLDLMVTQNDARAAIHVLHTILKTGPPHDIVSHISLALVALQRRDTQASRSSIWNYLSDADDQRIRDSFDRGLNSVNKGEIVLDNVSLALSVVRTDDFAEAPSICQGLLRLTEDRFARRFADYLPPANFAQSLFKITRVSVGDIDTLSRIVRLLAHLGLDNWISHVHDGETNGFTILLDAIFSHEQGLNEQTLKPVARLLQLIALLSDEEFLRIFSLEDLSQHQTAIVNLMTSVDEFNGLFIRKMLSLVASQHNHPTSALLFATQIELVVRFLGLIHYKPYEVGFRANGYGMVQAFFNRILEAGTTPCWPSYFASAGIIEFDNHQEVIQNTSGLTFINPTRLLLKMNEAREQGAHHLYHAWIGEALTLLWRRALREHATGFLLPSWTDLVFFQDQPVSIMLEYYKDVLDHRYNGIDLKLLGKYFKKALEIESNGCPEDTNLFMWPLRSNSTEEAGNDSWGGRTPEELRLESRHLRHKRIEEVLISCGVSLSP